jgi:translation initiation factor IF-1
MAIAFTPWKLVEEILLDFSSITTKGIVLESHKTILGVNDKFIYQVEFQFEDDGHISYKGKCYREVPIESGKEVSIEYWPKDLNMARIAGCSKNPGGYFGAMVISFPIIGIFMLIESIRNVRQKLKLLETGIAVEGLVITSWSKRDSEGDKIYYIKFSFNDEQGKRIETQKIDKEITSFVKDMPIHVFYDPKHHEQILILESLF